MSYLPMSMPSSTKTMIGLSPMDEAALEDDATQDAVPSSAPLFDIKPEPAELLSPSAPAQKTLLGAGPGQVASSRLAYFFPPASDRPTPSVIVAAKAAEVPPSMRPTTVLSPTTKAQPNADLPSPDLASPDLPGPIQPSRVGPTIIPEPPMDRMAVTLMGVSVAVFVCLVMVIALLSLG